MQAAVCDGDTIGFTTCKVHDCKEKLASQNARFCPQHQYLKDKCAVTDCASPHALGFRTCDDTEHRALETAYFKRGKAIFQLRARLKKAGVAVPVDSVALEDGHADDDEVIIESGPTGPVELDCDSKPAGGNRRLRAYFGKRRTHNEQLIMRPCGVIVSRATFYGSEAVSAVNVGSSSNILKPRVNCGSGLCQSYLPFTRIHSRVFCLRQ